MITKRILIALTALTGLSGCWVNEASEPKTKELEIVADYLSPEDSAVINDFSKSRKVTIHLQVLQPQDILKRVRQTRYNAGMDILITRDNELLLHLQELDAFRKVRNSALFSQLERQFNNKHHHWIPLSHDPLVLTTHKDTSGTCRKPDFRNSLIQEGKRPTLVLGKYTKAYSELLKASSRYKQLTITPENTMFVASGRIYPLSALVDLQEGSDSISHTQLLPCRFFLIDKQRYVTLMNYAGIYRYGRNGAEAEKLLTFLLANSYRIASGRNHLPTSKNAVPNWYIRSLVVE